MNDLISRQAAKLAIVEKGQASKRYKVGEFWELNRNEIWDALDGVPSAQPEIIRCKDCKHSYDAIGGSFCSFGVCVDCIVDPDFYCANAERRTE